jgi:hypothetical protein
MHPVLGYWVLCMALLIHVVNLLGATSYELDSKMMSCTVDSTAPVVYVYTGGLSACFDLCIDAEGIICDLFSWDPLPKACVFRKDGCAGNLVQTNDPLSFPNTYRVTQPAGDWILRIAIPWIATGVFAFLVLLEIRPSCRKRCARAAAKDEVPKPAKKKDVKGLRGGGKWSYDDLPIFKNGPDMIKAVDTGVKNVNFTPYKKSNSTCPRLTCARLTGDESKRRWSHLPRFAKLVATLASTLFNVIFIVFEFYTMPDRSPDVPLDLTRKLVVVGEFSNVLIMAVQLIASLFAAKYGDSDCDFRADTAIAAMESLRMSSFSLIMLASPGAAMKLWSTWKSALILDSSDPWQKWVFCVTIFGIFYTLNVGLGVLAMAAKLSQFSFLSSIDMMDWTSTQRFLFAAMANQLAGLGSNHLRYVL